MKKSLFLLLALCCSLAASAQYGGMNNGYGGGMNRSMGGGMNNIPSTPRENKPVDYVQTTLDRMTKELTLDSFQTAVIKELLVEYKESVMAVQAQDLPDEGKYDKMKAASDKMDKKIIEVLNEDQKAKYAEMKAQKLKGAKGKKGKNKKNPEPEQQAPEDIFKNDTIGGKY